MRMYLDALLGGTFSLFMLFAIGCGTPDDGNSIVAGTVTLDGKPLSEGTLSLFPVGTGKPTSTKIVEGAYSITAEPGTYKVEISRMVSTGAAVADPDYGIDNELEESIPPQYNSRSELRMEIVIGRSDTHDFSLTSEKL